MNRATLPRPPGPARAGRSVPRIHPRIALRWAQVRREQGRRRLRVVLAAAALVLVVALAAGSLYSPLLEVRHVRLSTVGAVSRLEVLAVTGLSRPQPLIEVDTGALAARLDAVADLGGAVVRRSWPTTVKIRVVRRTPIAVVARTVGAGGVTDWATVDVTGRVLADVGVRMRGLTLLQVTRPVPAPGGWLTGSAGPGASVDAAAGRSLVDLGAAPESSSVPSGPAAALAVVAVLPASIRDDVQSVTVGAGGQITMAVLPATIAAGSIAVDLGDGSQLAQKVTALVTLLTQTSLSGVANIDLTVPDRPAVLTAR